MGIVRTERPDGDWFMAHKGWAEDDDLTWEARGLLAYLFTKPDDWQVQMGDLVNSGPCKKHKLRRVMKELEEAGYADREKKRKDDGTFQWVTTITERPPPTSSRMESVQPGKDRGYTKEEGSTKEGMEGSSGSARAQARMPEQLEPVYGVYQDTVDGYLSEYDPGQADALVMREWEQSGVSSAVLGLLDDYDWPTFVTGVVVTKDHADNPNAVYLQKLLSALQEIQTNGIDYTEAGEEEAKSDLERLFTAAQHA